jgi:phage gpG-like protein
MKVTGVTFTIDREKLKRSLVAAVNTGINRAADVYVVAIKESFSKTSRGTASAAGSPPSVQRNSLRKGITHTPAKDGVAIVHTSKTTYAAIQEFGGVIRAKGKRFLPVPLSFEARRIQEREGGLRASGVPMHVIRTKAGKLLLVKRLIRRGKNATKLIGSQAMFVLVKSVRLPARPYMAPAERSATLYAKAVQAFEAGAMAQIRGAFK